MVEEHPAGRCGLFGVALDPTDDELKLAFKAIQARDFAAGRLRSRNPYEAFTRALQDLIESSACEAAGEIEIPLWLTPTPTPSDLSLVTAENNLRFIDGGGCREVAERVRSFMEAGFEDSIPAMVAVDHSMTGGALRALSEKQHPASMTVLVVDSHFDGLQLAERMELARHGQGNQQYGSGNDPLGRFADGGAPSTAIQETYNCATWLKHMLDDQVVLPERLIVFGVSDYPSASMRHDPGLRRYVDAYRAFEETGVTFVTKEEIRQRGVRNVLEPLLKERGVDRLYLSLDADIGSLDAVHAARFMNTVGLGSEELYELASVLRETLQTHALAGLDVCGIETFLLGREFPNGVKDRTLERLSDFIRTLFGYESRYFDSNSPESLGRTFRHSCGSRNPSAYVADGSPPMGGGRPCG